MTSDAELTGLGDDVEDLIAAHGAGMEDFIREALLGYAEEVLIECSLDSDPTAITRSHLPNAVAVLNALGWYEPEPALDGRAHEVDGVLADQKQDAAAAAHEKGLVNDYTLADAHDSARSQAAFDFA
jgi:hypothetical protein